LISPKKSLTLLEKRYQRIRATIGTPTTARGSIPRTALTMSPVTLTSKPPTPSGYAQRLPTKNPYAHAAHAAQTTARSSGAQTPIRENDSRARGFSFHIGSRAPPGLSSEIADKPLASTPTANRHASAVTPAGLLVAGKFTRPNPRTSRSRLTGCASAASDDAKRRNESAARAC